MTDIWLMKQMEDVIIIFQEGCAREMLETRWFLKGMGGKCLKMDVNCR